MRHKGLLGIGVAAALFLLAQPASAVNYSGKIKIVQINSAGTRFLTSTNPVSLYATGDFKETLLQAFFKKANVDVGYTVIPCPAGITGVCGTVSFVSVDVANVP